MTYYLEIRTDGRRLEPFLIDQERSVVGRRPECDLVLSDPHASREQLAIEYSPDSGCAVVDLGGKNPLRVNGTTVERSALELGDRIEIGTTELILREGAPPPYVEDDWGSGSATVAVVPREVSSNAHTMSVDSNTLPGSQATADTSRRLDIFYRLAEKIAAAPDVDEFLRSVLDHLFTAVPAQRGFIALGDHRSGSFQPVKVRNDTGEDHSTIEMSQTILDEIQMEKKAMLVQDAPGEIPGSESIVRLNIKGFMCAPMFIADEFQGAIYADQVGAQVPFSEEDLIFLNGIARLTALTLDNLQLSERIKKENTSLRAILRRRGQLIAKSSVMVDIFNKIQRLGDLDSSVLIGGETGTGKELVARAIHDASNRKDGPFIAFNCSLSTPALIENELFGHVKGAFTDATTDKKGKFELADKGTIFLDEIGDMPESTQAKILRVLQEHYVEPLGGEKSIPIDIRVICATHKDLEKLRNQNKFRDDLYYRLAVLKLELPPLRDRGEDVLEIAASLLPEEFKLEDPARKALLKYQWPGNVRELQNVIEQACFNAPTNKIRLTDLPKDVEKSGRSAHVTTHLAPLRDVEARHIRKVLRATKNNKKRAAEILGISRETLYQKIKLYEIDLDS